MKYKQKITHNLLNVPGWRTKRHIVLIESDDWGSIRMPSKAVYEKLLSEGYRVDLHPYERYDSLASEVDLSRLFHVLKKYRDKNGRHPIVTANCAVANPDFDKIEKNGFTKYYYEPFTKTLHSYRGCEKSFDLWKQGIQQRIFVPQFHAREHINVAKWMSVLRKQDKDNLDAFRYGMMGIFPKQNHEQGNIFQVALDNSEYEEQSVLEIISDGLDLFEQIFEYKSKTFIAPCYTWPILLERKLYDKGVKGLQGMVYQKVPGQKRKRHWMGTKNTVGQVYTIRNCFFEPSLMPNNYDNIDECLYRINCAFRWNKPAILSSHRINYIGTICEENREKNLNMFERLFSQILKEWPDVEFLSSDELVELILNNDVG